MKAQHDLSSAFFSMLTWCHSLLCCLCFSHIELCSSNIQFHSCFRTFIPAFQGFHVAHSLSFRFSSDFTTLERPSLAILHNVDLPYHCHNTLILVIAFAPVWRHSLLTYSLTLPLDCKPHKSRDHVYCCILSARIVSLAQNWLSNI